MQFQGHNYYIAGMCARLEIRVHGRVQGVAFRWYAQRQAAGLGLTGWVRNLPDGSVRIVAEGSRQDLQALADWTACGPDHARIDGQGISWSEASGEFSDFRISG